MNSPANSNALPQYPHEWEAANTKAELAYRRALQIPAGLSAGVRPGSGAAKAKALNKGVKKKAAGAKGRKGAGKLTEDAMNEYGVMLGIPVAILGAFMEAIRLRYQPDLFTFPAPFHIQIIISSCNVIATGIAFYFAMMIIEKRYPLGNMLIMAGLVAWVPQLGLLIPYNENTLMLVRPFVLMWGVGSTYAIIKGLIETDDEGKVVTLIIIKALLYWMFDQQVNDIAEALIEFQDKLF